MTLLFYNNFCLLIGIINLLIKNSEKFIVKLMHIKLNKKNFIWLLNQLFIITICLEPYAKNGSIYFLFIFFLALAIYLYINVLNQKTLINKPKLKEFINILLVGIMLFCIFILLKEIYLYLIKGYITSRNNKNSNDNNSSNNKNHNNKPNKVNKNKPNKKRKKNNQAEPISDEEIDKDTVSTVSNLLRKGVEDIRINGKNVHGDEKYHLQGVNLYDLGISPTGTPLVWSVLVRLAKKNREDPTINVSGTFSREMLKKNPNPKLISIFNRNIYYNLLDEISKLNKK